MWFGTYDGINRYDGLDFKTYRFDGKPNSLSSNLIQALATDNENNILVATFADGISIRITSYNVCYTKLLREDHQ